MDLKPGLELDLLIRNNVMGYKERDERTCPAYSTSISAAWKVVEEIQSIPNRRSTTIFTIFQDDKGWRACFWGSPYVSTSKDTGARADTAALAICLSALKFMGVEI